MVIAPAAALASSALRLTSGEAVKAFLLGRWALSRKIDYRIGGGRGGMTGVATFTELPLRRDALLYEERGTVELEGVGRPFEAYRKYVFNTGCWPVEVYFVDDPSKKDAKSLIPELDFHTSFFIELPFADGPSIDGCGTSRAEASHLCINDLYSGSLHVTGQDCFEWRWSVKGPQKDADIMGVYTRSG